FFADGACLRTKGLATGAQIAGAQSSRNRRRSESPGPGTGPPIRTAVSDRSKARKWIGRDAGYSCEGPLRFCKRNEGQIRFPVHLRPAERPRTEWSVGSAANGRRLRRVRK